MAFTDMSLRHTILALTEEMTRFGRISTIFFDMACDLLARRILLRHCEDNSKGVAGNHGALTARQLRRVLALIEDRLAEDISLDDLAGAAWAEPLSFRARVQGRRRKTPHRWLVGLRIERAKQLLVKRNMTIIDVAALVGFDSQSHFGQVFLDHVGIPPANGAAARFPDENQQYSERRFVRPGSMISRNVRCSRSLEIAYDDNVG